MADVTDEGLSSEARFFVSAILGRIPAFSSMLFSWMACRRAYAALSYW